MLKVFMAFHCEIKLRIYVYIYIYMYDNYIILVGLQSREGHCEVVKAMHVGPGSRKIHCANHDGQQ